MVYVCVILLICWGIQRYDGKPYKNASSYFWFCCWAIILTFGLRYRVGGDTLNYLIKYERIAPLRMLSFTQLFHLDLEPAFAFLMAFFKQTPFGFYGVQMVESILVNIVWFKLIDDYTNRKFLAILLYYILHSFYFNTEIMREAMAVSFFSLAYLQLRKGSLVKYYLWMIPSIACHYSAFFMLLVPFLVRYVKNEWYAWFAVCVFNLSTLYAPSVFPFMGGYLGDKFTNNVGYSFNFWGTFAAAIKFVIYPLVLLYLYRRYITWDKSNPNVRLLYVAFIYGSLSLGEYSILMRLSNYLQPFLLLILAQLLEVLLFGRFKRQGLVLALSCFLWINYLSGYFKYESKYVQGARMYCVWLPYYSVFDEQTDPTREVFVRALFDDLRQREL